MLCCLYTFRYMYIGSLYAFGLQCRVARCLCPPWYSLRANHVSVPYTIQVYAPMYDVYRVDCVMTYSLGHHQRPTSETRRRRCHARDVAPAPAVVAGWTIATRIFSLCPEFFSKGSLYIHFSNAFINGCVFMLQQKTKDDSVSAKIRCVCLMLHGACQARRRARDAPQCMWG